MYVNHSLITCFIILVFCIAFSIITNMTIPRINMSIYWSLIVIAYIVTVFALGVKGRLQSIYVAVAFFLLGFLMLEILYFGGKVGIWNEQERVQSSYQWFDVYLDEKGKDKTADLTEGYFIGNEWNVSPEQAVRQKFDKLFEILRLKPGMTVLDIGCGYGQWMSYLKERGVASVGFTLTDVQVEEGKRKGLDIRLQDGRTFSEKYYGQFDAVTLLGSLEHFAKCSFTDQYRHSIYKLVMKKAKAALKPESESRMIMTTTINGNSSTFGIVDYLKTYFLERFFSGRYPLIGELNEAAEANGMSRVHNSDQTEDYRWMSIINPDHFGNFKIKEWTPKRIFHALNMVLTDPFAVHKWLYHVMGVWMWHLGGVSNEFDRTRHSPYRLKWEGFRYTEI